MTESKTSEFIPRDYDIFVGLDVDKKSMAVTFTDHGTLQRSLRLPNNGRQLLNYTRKHFPEQRLALFTKRDPPARAPRRADGSAASMSGSIAIDGAQRTAQPRENESSG